MKIGETIKIFFQRPFHILLICAVFLIFNLFIDGTLLHIFRLGRDLRIIQNRTHHLQEKNKEVKARITRFSDPDFIEEEARERLDFAGEEDIIFIFPEDI